MVVQQNKRLFQDNKRNDRLNKMIECSRQRMEQSVQHNERLFQNNKRSDRLHKGMEQNDRFSTTERNNRFSTRERNDRFNATKWNTILLTHCMQETKI